MKLETLAQRHAYILKRLQKEENIRVNDLCDALGVSSVTIRKDLKLLEDKNLLFRSHGSISKVNPYTKDVNVREKEQVHLEEKIRIGNFAATQVEAGEAIIIASGTTVLQMAKAISVQGRLTVLTSAMNVAMALLSPQQDFEVVQLGGIVRKTSTSVTGHFAETMLENFACSKLFLGVDGIDIQQGCTTSNMMEARLNKTMIDSAQKTIVLTDSTKFGRRGFCKICGIHDIDMLITDDGIADSYAKWLENEGIELKIA